MHGAAMHQQVVRLRSAASRNDAAAHTVDAKEAALGVEDVSSAAVPEGAGQEDSAAAAAKWGSQSRCDEDRLREALHDLFPGVGSKK